RWQLGLVQTLFQNPSLFFHPGHGVLGLFAIPYYWIVEAFSPLVELMAFIVVPYAVYQGWIGLDLVLTFLGVGLLFNLFITLIGIKLDRQYVSRTGSWNYLKNSLETLLMNFGYRQLTSYWRFMALMR